MFWLKRRYVPPIGAFVQKIRIRDLDFAEPVYGGEWCDVMWCMVWGNGVGTGIDLGAK